MPLVILVLVLNYDKFSQEDSPNLILNLVSRRINPDDDKTKDIRNNDFYGNINKRRYTTNIGAHKYSPRRYYKDYFAIKKRKE